MPKQPSPFKAFKNLKPKKLIIDQETLVTHQPLDPHHGLPLLIQPAVDDLDAGHWMASRRDWIEAKLLHHGALLFRGFAVRSAGEFESFASAICPDLYGDYGDLPPASGRVYGVTPYPPDGTILFHNESSHMHRWPMRQFFFCAVPARTGGTTPIVDCRRVFQELEPGDRELLRRHRFRYVRNFHQGVDVSWQDFFKTDDRDQVAVYCQAHGIKFRWKGDNHLMTWQVGPSVMRHPFSDEWVIFNQIQLHHISCLEPDLRKAMLNMFTPEDLPRNVYLEDGSPLEDAFVKRIEALYWKHSVSFPWRSCDVLLVDNMLVSHARNPYTPPREMYVAMGNIHTPSSQALP